MPWNGHTTPYGAKNLARRPGSVNVIETLFTTLDELRGRAPLSQRVMINIEQPAKIERLMPVCMPVTWKNGRVTRLTSSAVDVTQ